MKNPLTLEERAHTLGLVGHDLGNVMGNLSFMHLESRNARRNRGTYEKRGLYLQHMFDTLNALKSFASENIGVDSEDSRSIESNLRMIKEMLAYHKADIHYKVDLHNLRLNTNVPLVYTALYNLAKNSLRFVPEEGGLIIISAFDFQGQVPNLVYANDKTLTEGRFVNFNVRDNGSGFSNDRPTSDFLKLGVSTKENGGGFGLYYASLVCKFLGAHLAIDSQPGNTTVSIYHPLNLK